LDNWWGMEFFYNLATRSRVLAGKARGGAQSVGVEGAEEAEQQKVGGERTSRGAGKCDVAFDGQSPFVSMAFCTFTYLQHHG